MFFCLQFFDILGKKNFSGETQTEMSQIICYRESQN